MYYQDYYIHTYEVDKNKRLLVSALLNYFQDAMVHNADSFGAGSDYAFNNGQLWVLVDYEIDIFDLPLGKTMITCSTAPYAIKRFFAFRKWEMRDSKGNLIAIAKGKFVLIDIKTKDIVAPTEEMIKIFKNVIEEGGVTPFTKNNPLDTEVIYKSEDVVKSTYIDINNHMNNVYYMIIAYNNIPHEILDTCSIKKIRITYKKECVINDLLTIEGRRDDKTFYYEIKNNDIILSKVSFKLKEVDL